ncbi:ATP-binding protein [Desulfovibrio mangrovi]|uniref:PAS domain-containing sensor histidine kinase n=1 Tax=Desulfovibrio mangrovi TaxID=2976983 RepID=UPI00224621E6|nr:ATP-binding protein [Desulfovibrio mangrovi]UZP67100.1 ATP-binding protein [Desulfovibrio mangrovi]
MLPDPPQPPEIQPEGHTPPQVLRFLRQISDSASGGDALDLGYAGSLLCPLLGISRRDLLQALTKALCADPIPAILARQMRNEERGVFEPYTIRLMTVDGHPADIQVCPRPILLPDETELVTATLGLAPADMDRQRAVQAERDRLLGLLDRLPAFVALVAPDYSLRYHNQTFKEIFGSSLKHPCYKVIKNQSEPCPTCPPFDVFDTGSLSIYEWTNPANRQAFRIYSYPFTDEDSSPLVLKLGIDITQSKQVQEALIMSEARYRSITDNLAVGIAVVDASMRITAANPLFSQWFGITLNGNHVPTGHLKADALFAAACGAGSNEPVAEAQAGAWNPKSMLMNVFTDGRVRELEFACQLPSEAFLQTDDGLRALRITACPTRDVNNSVNSVILLLEDITERKRVTEQLNRARQLEAMGTLAAGIAHEINQPLSALRLYASGLELLVEQQHGLSQENLLERLGWILREADNIQEIIAHMRSLVMQQDAPPIGRASLNKAVQRALGLVGAQLNAHGIQLDLQLATNLPDALANLVQLEQVVINLVVNAMHALDTIDSSRQADKWIRISTEQLDNGSLRLRVADNGPGLQGLEKRIFDPFFTTKDAGSGMGLGLSIVHTFVEAWRGEISTVSTMQGSGATFIITLHPADAEAGVTDAHTDS